MVCNVCSRPTYTRNESTENTSIPLFIVFISPLHHTQIATVCLKSGLLYPANKV